MRETVKMFCQRKIEHFSASLWIRVGIQSGVDRSDLHTACSLVIVDSVGWLCTLDVTIKEKEFRFIGVYMTNIKSEFPDFFQLIDLFVTSPRQVILLSDSNAVPYHNIGHEVGRKDTNTNQAAE